MRGELHRLRVKKRHQLKKPVKKCNLLFMIRKVGPFELLSLRLNVVQEVFLSSGFALRSHPIKWG